MADDNVVIGCPESGEIIVVDIMSGASPLSGHPITTLLSAKTFPIANTIPVLFSISNDSVLINVPVVWSQIRSIVSFLKHCEFKTIRMQNSQIDSPHGSYFCKCFYTDEF